MNFFEVMSDWAAKTAAKYNAYLARENAKVQELAKQKAIAEAKEQAEEYSLLVLDVFYTALQNCAPVIEAHVPTSPEMCVDESHIYVNGNGFTIYRLFYYRKCSDKTSQEVQSIMQSELKANCYRRGLPRLVCKVSFLENNRTSVEVAWKGGFPI